MIRICIFTESVLFLSSQGKFEVRGSCRVDVEFTRNRRGDTAGGSSSSSSSSSSRGDQGYLSRQEGDWICFKVHTHGFIQRGGGGGGGNLRNPPQRPVSPPPPPSKKKQVLKCCNFKHKCWVVG